jgi:hypothetical protein
MTTHRPTASPTLQAAHRQTQTKACTQPHWVCAADLQRPQSPAFHTTRRITPHNQLVLGSNHMQHTCPTVERASSLTHYPARQVGHTEAPQQACRSRPCSDVASVELLYLHTVLLHPKITVGGVRNASSLLVAPGWVGLTP